MAVAATVVEFGITVVDIEADTGQKEVAYCRKGLEGAAVAEYKDCTLDYN